MNAMYEKKLALQAESYIQLKIAYEELTQVPHFSCLFLCFVMTVDNVHRGEKTFACTCSNSTTVWWK